MSDNTDNQDRQQDRQQDSSDSSDSKDSPGHGFDTKGDVFLRSLSKGFSAPGGTITTIGSFEPRTEIHFRLADQTDYRFTLDKPADDWEHVVNSIEEVVQQMVSDLLVFCSRLRHKAIDFPDKCGYQQAITFSDGDVSVVTTSAPPEVYAAKYETPDKTSTELDKFKQARSMLDDVIRSRSQPEGMRNLERFNTYLKASIPNIPVIPPKLQDVKDNDND